MDIWGVTFGDYHTYNDWGLVLTGPVAVSLPVAQTNLIEIPGRSGLLDLSEALTGAPAYSSRTLRANLAALVAPEDWASMYATILNAIHGQRLNIVLDEDPDYYLTGRVTVEEPTWQDGFWRLTISAVCDPYRLRPYVSQVEADLAATDTVLELDNDAMPTPLTAAVTAETVLTWDGASIALSAGSEVTLSRLLPAGGATIRARCANPIAALTVNIEPVQSGSGDPSPTNVRPITGWTGLHVYVSDADTTNPTTYTMDWMDDAGTVYGGTLDVTTGLLTVDRLMVDLATWTTGWQVATQSGYTVLRRRRANILTGTDYYTRSVLCSHLAYAGNSTSNVAPGTITNLTSNYYNLTLCLPEVFTSQAEFNAWTAAQTENGTPVQYSERLATPVTYQLDPVAVSALPDVNTIASDAGTVDVTWQTGAITLSWQEGAL